MSGIYQGYIRGISGVYQGYIRERGMPPNGLKKPPGRDDGRGPMENAIVLMLMFMFMLFPRRGPASCTGRIDSAGSGKENAGG